MAQANTESSTTLPRAAAIEIAAALMLPERAIAELQANRRDPIFQAVARHWLAEQKLERVLGAEGEGPRIAKATIKAAWSNVGAACDALLTTLPTTVGGLATLLWYVKQNQDVDNSLGTTDFLARVEGASLASLRAHGEH